MATLEEEYQRNAQNAQTQGVDTAQLQGGSYDQINQMYDAQKQAQLSGLEQAYNQQKSNAQAARDELPGQYQARANDLAVQYERNRRNLNEQAAANGINTGAGSQMQLALGSNYQRDYGGIRTAEQKAIEEADRNMRDMEASYQSAVQQAVADNDYKRAQALLSEYQNQYSQKLQQAQTLASYGDFSAYLNIPGYSQQQVDAMRSAWIAANPDMAYNTGAITADQYKAMTGSWPAGYAAKTGTSGLDTGGQVFNTWEEYEKWQEQQKNGDNGETGDEGSDTGSGKSGRYYDYLVSMLGRNGGVNATPAIKDYFGSKEYNSLSEDEKWKLANAYYNSLNAVQSTPAQVQPTAPAAQSTPRDPWAVVPNSDPIKNNRNYLYDMMMNP